MVATMVIFPPWPPSPPLGPPRGTYFSRRNARQPLPPSPALTVIFTSSTNIWVPACCAIKKPPVSFAHQRLFLAAPLQWRFSERSVGERTARLPIARRTPSCPNLYSDA